jgi:hypothetical protein
LTLAADAIEAKMNPEAKRKRKGKSVKVIVRNCDVIYSIFFIELNCDFDVMKNSDSGVILQLQIN